MADGLERTPLSEDLIPAPVRRLFAAGTPAQTRLRVARGAAPLLPRDLVAVLYQLALDAEAEVAEAARKTAGELPDAVLLKVLAEPLDARVLDLFAELCGSRPAAIEVLLLNWATDDLTVVRITRTTGERELEIVAANETRLLRCPAIVEALYLNKKTRMSTVDRVMEMAARRGLRLEGIPAFEEALAALGLGTPTPPAAPAAPAGEAAPPDGDSDFDALLDVPGTVEAADFDDVKGVFVDEEKEKKRQNIQTLSPSAKVRLATLGSKFHRLVLVQDSNRVVAMAAIKSPAITDMEVQRVASSRTVADDVIRYIANNKDWLKNYGVKKSLVNNPKTPIGVSVRLLTHLHPGDLKAIAKSKNIPTALRTAASQLDAQRRH
jgi:hypothetical protein